MTTYTLPESVAPWGPSGPTIPLPGSPEYVDGTDVSYPLLWLFTRTAFDGVTRTEAPGPFTAFSGTSEDDVNTIQFPAEATTWVEEGLKLGLGGNDGTKWVWAEGYEFPIFRAHAWRNVIFDGGGGILWQEDPTNFDDGVTKRNVTTTANSTTAVLDVALNVAQAARLADGTGQIQSDNTDFSAQNFTGTSTVGSVRLTMGTKVGATVQALATTVQSLDGTVFAGGQYGASIVGYEDDGKTVVVSSAALVAERNVKFVFYNPAGKSFVGGAKGTTIVSVAGDRKTLTLTDPAYWTGSDVPATVFLPPIKPERNGGVRVVTIDSPGSYGGVERAGMASNITLRNWRIRGSNPDGESGITNRREEWIGIFARRCGNVTIDSDVIVEDTWSDAYYLTSAGQQGLDDCDLNVEDFTWKATAVNNGRHAGVLQGCIGHRYDASSKTTERLAFDCETTDISARLLDTHLTGVISPGTAPFHIAAAVVNGEPPRLVDNLTTIIGSQLVTMPGELLNSNDIGAELDHPNLPAGTYVRRRMSPTQIEVSQAATATGVADGILGGAVLLRDFVIQKLGCYTSTGNIPLDTRCPSGKVYFTCDTTAGSPTMTNVVFETRLDGQTFTTADIGNQRVFWGQAGVFAGSGATPVSVTSNTITFAANAAKTINSSLEYTFTGTVTAGSRILSSSQVFTNARDKNHAITGPTGLLRDGTVLVRGGEKVMSLPAKASGSGTFTMGGRMRCWVNLNDEPEWTGFTIEELRPLNPTAEWGGTGVVPSPALQPLFMLPAKTDEVTIRRNYVFGRLSAAGVVSRYIAGAITVGGGVVYGEPPGLSWTIAQNRGYQMVDNQVTPDPTVTVTLVLTVDDASSNSPTFTCTFTRSDGLSESGNALTLIRDGRDVMPGRLVGNTATFRSSDYVGPLVDGTFHTFQARWVGSWNSLSGLSNTIVVNPGDPDPQATTTALVVTPSSPQVEGKTLTLTATVSPDPSSIPGTVTFRDGATVLSTEDVVAGVATLVLGTGRPAGSHSFTATFNGNAGFLTSTSSTVSYTTTAAVSQVSTSTVLAAIPSSPQLEGQTVALNATVTPTPNGGRVNYLDNGTLIDNPPYGTPAVFDVDTPGTHTFTANYLGNAGFAASSDDLEFVVESISDPERPYVVTVDPEDGAIDVPVGQVVTVTFDQPVGDVDIRMELLNGTPVPGVVNDDDGTEVKTFTPNQPLFYNRGYRVRVVAATGQNTGSDLLEPFTSTFRTAARVGELIPSDLRVAR